MISGKISMVDPTLMTVCLVIHNEENVIDRCLKSISKVSRNIFVVHDGPCRDKSLEICKKYHATIVIRSHHGEAELHRAWQYGQVKTKWILQLDADEYLSAEFITHIDDLLVQDAHGYSCIWPYWNGSRYTTKVWPRKMILFQTRKMKFIAAPHEAAVVPPPVIDTPYRLEHKPQYDNLSVHSFQTKWLKWAKIHALCYRRKQPLTTFGYQDGETAHLHYYRAMRYPLFAVFFLPLYHLCGCILYGAWKEGYIGIKSSVMMSLYYAAVAYYIYSYDHISIL